MSPQEIFDRNLKLMTRFSGQYISEIQKIDCTSYEFCKTNLDEINLKTKIKDKLYFFHSQRGALQEAKQMLQEIPHLKRIETIIIYGLGLGYFYDAAKKWLEGNKNRVLIFLEDDCALIHRFLELPRATEMLTDPQVVVQAFRAVEESTAPTIPYEFDWICNTFVRTTKRIIVLKTYLEARDKETQFIRMMLHSRFSNLEYGLDEDYEIKIKELYAHFYSNLYIIPHSYRGQNFKDKFSDVPALVCGAGSSLSKIGNQIKELKDKALIFGAGTGMNVLNKMGTIPHFGGAIDPNVESLNRIKTNYAFEVPFFYMNRFQHNALRNIHGPLLFLRAQTTSLVENWFEKELGITDAIVIEARISTTNYLLNVTQMLGCNPIVLAGVDLAYTDKTRYPKEIQAHPLDSRMQEQQFKNLPVTSTRLVPVKNTEGEEVLSRYDWLTEGEAYTHFAKQFPDNVLLNVTKGGLPISDVPNPSLKEVLDTYLDKEYDFINFIHAAIQSSGKMPISPEKLIQTFNKWKKSLEDCISICSELISAFEFQREEMIRTGIIPPTCLSEGVTDIINKLTNEPAYEFCLIDMNHVHKKITLKGMFVYNWFPELFSQKELFLKNLEFEESRTELLKHVAKLHIDIIESVLQEVIEEVPPCIKPQDMRIPEQYSIENGRLIIYDEEMGLNINEPFEAQKVSHKQLKGEYFALNENFHGPSRFFTDKGALLAEGWFYHGKRIGKNWQYYTSGALYSIQRFKEGDWNGTQEYFYETGHKKSIINYSKGLLDGKVELFHPNGVLAREIHFSEGKLHGFERDWNAKGQKISESQFENNTPVGIARKWHPNGVLEIEKIYRDSVDHYDLRVWDEKGAKKFEQVYVKELGEELLQKSKERRNALDTLKKQLDDIKMKKKEG